MSSPARVLRARRPDPDRAPGNARHLLTAVVEAVDGRRPLTQLTGVLATPAVVQVDRVRSPGQGARLDRVRVCRISAEISELSGVVTTTRPGKVRARAARIERTGDRWRCTEFHLLP